MKITVDMSALDSSQRTAGWYSAINTFFPALDVTFKDGAAGAGRIVAYRAGKVGLSNIQSAAQVVERTDAGIKDGADHLMAGIALRGRGHASQDGRTIEMDPGAIAVFDASRPYLLDFATDYDVFVIHLPRQRLAAMLGPSVQYTTTPIDGSHGGTVIAGFFRELANNLDAMQPALVERMVSKGIDLLVEGIASKTAENLSPSLTRALLFHRATAYASANISSQHLKPSMIAAALKISLRTLHEVFAMERTTPSGWIWEQRLALARSRLGNAGFDRLMVGAIAWGCGFSSQAHFTRRFKQAYGMTPAAWRAQSRETLVEPAIGCLRHSPT